MRNLSNMETIMIKIWKFAIFQHRVDLLQVKQDLIFNIKKLFKLLSRVTK